MSNQFSRALETVRDGHGDTGGDAYREACTYLVAHRDELTCRVFIDIPGGLSSNTDPRWDEVRAGSESCCSCGNERVILPAVQRTEFVAGEASVVVKGQGKVYFRPIGGDRRSAYLCVWIEQDALAFCKDPCSGTFDFDALFSQPAYPLDKLEKALAGQPGQPAIMFTGRRVPVFGITAVDALEGTATLVLDKDVETFDPDASARHSHGEGA